MTASLEDLIESFEIHLQARNLSPRTIEDYMVATRRLARWLPQDEWAAVTKRDLERYLANLAETSNQGGVSHHYRSLQQFFKWLAAEEEIDSNPFVTMKPPQVPEQPVDPSSVDDLKKLFDVCKGKDFISRRDTAILSLFLDTGLRKAELANLKVTDVDLKARQAFVIGKGSKPRAVRFGRKTTLELDKYLRERRKERNADLPGFWLAEKNRGELGSDGIYQVVKRRARQAGISLHPHKLRHTFAHMWLEGEGREGDLMELAGWSSPSMVRRYGKGLAGERARAAHDRNPIRDRI